MKNALRKTLLQLHHDDRGNIGVLLLMVMWALLGLMAMVWNTGDLASRRQNIQTAADSSAHAGALWPARTLNAMSASNMVITENASANSVYNAVPIVYANLKSRFDQEEARAKKLMADAIVARRRGVSTDQALRLDLIDRCMIEVLRSLPLQHSILEEFNTRTAPAYTLMSAGDFPERRRQIFEYQQEIVRLTPSVVNEQRGSFQDFFKAEVTYALPTRPGDANGNVAVTLPLRELGGTGPQENPPLGPYGSDEELNIPNVHIPRAPWSEGGVSAPVYTFQFSNSGNPVVVISQIPSFTDGEILCPPLNRYFWNRISNDIGYGRADSLHTLLSRIDDERWRLTLVFDAICAVPVGVPPNLLIIYETTREEVGRMSMEDRRYDGGNYATYPDDPYSGTDRHRMASRTYSDTVQSAGRRILRELGQTPQYTFETFDRYPVPDWARPAKFQSAYQHCYDWVHGRTLDAAVGYANWYYGDKIGARNANGTPRAVHSPRSPVWREGWRAGLAYLEPFARIAGQVQGPKAGVEWIARWWPYEIKPPETPVPPTPGLTPEMRHEHLTLVAAARTLDTSSPKVWLPKLSGFTTDPLVATSQAELFNWMEYSSGYGASDRYDEWNPPLPWRLSTRGGWNWNSRLTASDAMSGAMDNNPKLREFLDSVHITSSNQSALDKVLNH